MRTYAEFQPTGFDSKGAFLPDRQDWIVVPVSRTRDSGILTESNFATAVKMLGGESETVEVHRFGHWGPGWFEIIIVAPGSPAAHEANAIEASLSDYSVLDDEDYSKREFESACNYWEHASVRERVELCRNAGLSIFAARHEEIPWDDNGRLWESLTADC